MSAVAAIESAAHVAKGADASGCFHCGLPVPAQASWSVRIGDSARPICCPGCAAVAQAIVDNGLGDYYQTRSAFSVTADQAPLVPAELALFDAPEALAQFAGQRGEAEDAHEAVFSVEGLRCAACMWLIERRLAQLPGVQAANLNMATECLSVRWQAARCKPSDILAALRELGYPAYPFDVVRHGEQLQRAGKTLFRQLFVAGLSMMQVMMYAAPAYVTTEGEIDTDLAGLMRWASLLLTAPAVFYSALPFFKGAWRNLKARMLGMDVPVALGIAAAFGGSVAATLRGHGAVYFDSVTMFIFLLLCSRYLELGARRKAASALERLRHGLPASASRMPGFPGNRAVETVSAAQLRSGDVILIKPGESIAADCEIVEGATSVDISLLTGESLPVYKATGDTLPSGALNATQPVAARVLKPARESTLSALLKLVERAGQSKPQIAQWADKVAAWFVAALLLFALATFIYWHGVDATRAWPIAIAVLVVSCPCALSLATPAALAAATDRLLRQGVLVVQPHVIETLHRATHVIFDKTGTLTTGKPVLQNTACFGTVAPERCLRIAAALEGGSAHPLGSAIIDAAHHAGGGALFADEVLSVDGQGLEGRVDGMRYRLGSARFVEQIAGSALPHPAIEGATAVYLGTAGAWLARFDLMDTVRDDAREVVAYFQAAGKTVLLLSGDRHAVAQCVASELGIESAYGDCLPVRKMKFVQDLQAHGAVVAMIGDGINDAAVLRAADVSFALGSGAALAQAHADTVLLSGRLGSVMDTARTATRTMSVIRQNLAWATLYNVIAIPAAALGLLNPWLSGIGMALSATVVVANSLRLRGMPKRLQVQAASVPSCPLSA
jgi:P-type Cu2+ transporter